MTAVSQEEGGQAAALPHARGPRSSQPRPSSPAPPAKDAGHLPGLGNLRGPPNSPLRCLAGCSLGFSGAAEDLLHTGGSHTPLRQHLLLRWAPYPHLGTGQETAR